ncbi:thyroglobulin isoform X2 [Gadus morhua]|nr:thyroglobulin-like isoform X2 [Gadus morhua]XP_030194016.1 thyroglobulin-like isoform X2 [Gadus morhua]
MRGGAITLGLLQLLLLVELGHTAALNSTIKVAPHITNPMRCQRERPDFRLLTPVVIRSYVPTCDDDGNFTPMQCSGSKGYCWCVNIYTGVEIPRPRTPPGKMPPRCELLVELGPTAALSNTLEMAHHVTHLTRCQSDRDAARLLPPIGSYVPTCDDDGNFTPEQCWASTGYCWCVNNYTGEEIPGSRTPPGYMRPRCELPEELSPTAAFSDTLERDHYIIHHKLCQSERTTRIGSNVLTCDDDGNFTPGQCFKGYCWCVNIYTGVEIPGSRTPPGNTPPRCASDHEPFSGDFCPPGWTRYGIRCFNFIEKPTRWIQAQINCRFQGSNLVSVHSQEENRFLQELSAGASFRPPLTWIGAGDCMEPTVFLWTDGSAFDYENFPRFPMNTNGNCVGMNVRFDRGRRVWMKGSCESLNPYICANNI